MIDWRDVHDMVDDFADAGVVFNENELARLSEIWTRNFYEMTWDTIDKPDVAISKRDWVAFHRNLHKLLDQLAHLNEDARMHFLSHEGRIGQFDKTFEGLEWLSKVPRPFVASEGYRESRDRFIGELARYWKETTGSKPSFNKNDGSKPAPFERFVGCFLGADFRVHRHQLRYAASPRYPETAT